MCVCRRRAQKTGREGGAQGRGSGGDGLGARPRLLPRAGQARPFPGNVRPAVHYAPTPSTAPEIRWAPGPLAGASGPPPRRPSGRTGRTPVSAALPLPPPGWDTQARQPALAVLLAALLGTRLSFSSMLRVEAKSSPTSGQMENDPPGRKPSCADHSPPGAHRPLRDGGGGWGGVWDAQSPCAFTSPGASSAPSSPRRQQTPHSLQWVKELQADPSQ